MRLVIRSKVGQSSGEALTQRCKLNTFPDTLCRSMHHAMVL